jgi:hypothetical protein
MYEPIALLTIKTLLRAAILMEPPMLIKPLSIKKTNRYITNSPAKLTSFKSPTTPILAK